MAEPEPIININIINIVQKIGLIFVCNYPGDPEDNEDVKGELLVKAVRT